MAHVGGRRSWVRQGLILEEVRSQIIRGEWGPGARVPTRDELERRFQASRVTIQRAFDALIQEGFVEPRGRLGTFVSVTPPHLFRYQLVFPLQGETASRRSSLEQALLREARAVSRIGPQKIGVFAGIRDATDVAGFRALEDDVEACRIGGLIFVGGPDSYEGSRLLTNPMFPQVCLSGAGTAKSMQHIELDRSAFFEEALKGALPRKRVALLTSKKGGDKDAMAFQNAVKQSGMKTEPHWLHRVDLADGEMCRGLATLLMQGPKERRPDLLILTEELLLPNLQRGLADAGVDPTRDVRLIVQSYLRGEPRSLVPATVLAYDLRELLATCISLLEAQRSRGTEVTQVVECLVGIRR